LSIVESKGFKPMITLRRPRLSFVCQILANKILTSLEERKKQ